MTSDPSISRNASASHAHPHLRRYAPLALALVVSALHFSSFDIGSQAIVTDARYYLYFAWRVADGAVPHLDLFDNKNQLATFTGALLYRSADAVGLDPLLVIRAGFLVLAAACGLLVFTIQRRLSGGSPVAGLLGLLAYTSFGLLGVLPSIGNVPKVLMALFASAMALFVQRGRWFLAGVAGAGAFLDWQVGALVGVTALASALVFGRPRGKSAVRVLLGGLTGLAPFALFFLVRGGLGAFFEQTIVASFFRGTASLQRETLLDRLDRMWFLIENDCPGRAWLVPLGLVGLAIAALRLRPWRASEEQRLLAPLCLYHAGILVFSLLDFQWHGDLFLLLHTIVFLLGLVWTSGLALVRDRWLAQAGHGLRAAALGVLVVLAVLVARPGFLRPTLELQVPGVRPDLTLADQREVARAADELFAARTVGLLEHSELLFLLRQENALPVIYWNNATWSTFRRADGEKKEVTAARLLRDVGADVFASPQALPARVIGRDFTVHPLRSASGAYEVVLWVR